ncbi:MAG: TVP38/TMEM64 family protein [Desulfotignum sp.]|nr:VTT domain-containing protein [Desulfobacteraceae bacterium]
MRGNLKILILISILAAGIIAQKMGLLDLTRAMDEIEYLADFWWLPPAAVLLQVVLYLFALPGSVVIWTLGVIYQPMTATLLFLTGGICGSLAAYFFAAHLSVSWTARFSRSKIFNILQKNSGFLHLCGLRCLPGFPHSLINYSAGILQVKILPFIMSTTIGFAIKGYIYCSAIYTAFHFEEEKSAITVMTVWPLLLLAGFSMLGIVIRKKFFNGSKQAL